MRYTAALAIRQGPSVRSHPPRSSARAVRLDRPPVAICPSHSPRLSTLAVRQVDWLSAGGWSARTFVRMHPDDVLADVIFPQDVQSNNLDSVLNLLLSTNYMELRPLTPYSLKLLLWPHISFDGSIQ